MSKNAAPEQSLASFVRAADPPGPATDRASLALIDFSLCALAGARTRTGRRLLKASAAGSPGGKCGAITPELVLAAVSHILDCDDNHDTIGGHPSCVLLPALLYGARQPGLTVSDLLVSYVVGLEVMAATARSVGRVPYQSGWHTTCIYGAVGAAAALARAHAADRRVTEASLGMAASFASGIKASFGTDAKSLQVGHAAQAGVLSYEMAAAGFSASAEALSGPQGLAAALGVSRPRWEKLSSLGIQWETINPGIVFKRFPCCASTHAPIEAILALRRHTAASPSIDVTIHAGRLRHVDRPTPRTALDAKFSLQFTVAAAWVDGNCSAAQFSEERLGDPRIRDIMPQVKVHGATDLPWSATRVRCTADGKTEELPLRAATGHSPVTPLTIGDLSAKADSLDITAADFTRICDRILAGNTSAQQFAGELSSALTRLASTPAGKDLGNCTRPSPGVAGRQAS